MEFIVARDGGECKKKNLSHAEKTWLTRSRSIWDRRRRGRRENNLYTLVE